MNNAVETQLSELGIEGYLTQHQHKSLLRFLTCGSVDDGKSTLIGRLLHDSKQIYEDQLAAVHNDSQRVGTTGEKPDLALLVDGHNIILIIDRSIMAVTLYYLKF